MAAMVGPGCERKITRTPLLRHWCLVSNLHRVRTMQYKHIIYLPMGPFSRAFTTARVAVNILDAIVRLGQYGTRRRLTSMNGVSRPGQDQRSSASRRQAHLWRMPNENCCGSLIMEVARAGGSSAKKWEAFIDKSHHRSDSGRSRNSAVTSCTSAHYPPF